MWRIPEKGRKRRKETWIPKKEQVKDEEKEQRKRTLGQDCYSSLLLLWWVSSDWSQVWDNWFLLPHSDLDIGWQLIRSNLIYFLDQTHHLYPQTFQTLPKRRIQHLFGREMARKGKNSKHWAQGPKDPTRTWSKVAWNESMAIIQFTEVFDSFVDSCQLTFNFAAVLIHTQGLNS